MIPTDKADQELKVGDIIVYGHALGRCAGLRFGKVLEIYEVEDRYSYRDPTKKKCHFRIRGVDAESGYKKPELLSRDSTLQFSDRIIKLRRDQMPEPVLKLLDSIRVES